MPNVGVIFPPWFPPERFRGAVEAAETSGVSELWVWEDCFCESGLSPAVAALAWTERLKVRVGLMPVPLRNVALSAMEVATIERLFPGRFQAVSGHGVQAWMGQVGARVESPLTLLREYLSAYQQLLRGETVSVSGRFIALEAVALKWPPMSAPKVMAGATGERTLRMLGEVVDAVLVDFGVSPQGLRETIALINEGSRKVGRESGPEIIHYAYGVIGDDAEARLTQILGDLPDDPELRRGACGSAAEIAEAIRRWNEAGAGTVVLRPPEDDPDIEGYIRFVGEEVCPLLDMPTR